VSCYLFARKRYYTTTVRAFIPGTARGIQGMPLPLSLSLSLRHSHTHSHTHTHTLSLKLSLSLTHSLSDTHTPSLSHTHTYTFSLSSTHDLSTKHYTTTVEAFIPGMARGIQVLPLPEYNCARHKCIVCALLYVLHVRLCTFSALKVCHGGTCLREVGGRVLHHHQGRGVIPWDGARHPGPTSSSPSLSLSHTRSLTHTHTHTLSLSLSGPSRCRQRTEEPTRFYFYRHAKARIWPRLSYMCHVRSAAVPLSRSKRLKDFHLKAKARIWP